MRECTQTGKRSMMGNAVDEFANLRRMIRLESVDSHAAHRLAARLEGEAGRAAVLAQVRQLPYALTDGRHSGGDGEEIDTEAQLSAPLCEKFLFRRHSNRKYPLYEKEKKTS